MQGFLLTSCYCLSSTSKEVEELVFLLASQKEQNLRKDFIIEVKELSRKNPVVKEQGSSTS